MNKADIVSFMNMKGGVGKTTLCASVGEYLANFEQKKILFIDLDPQFNLTQTFLREFHKEDEYRNDDSIPTVYAILANDIPRVGTPPPELRADDIIVNLNDKIDIIYGTLNMIRIKDSEGAKYKLKKFIEKNRLTEKYDYIFLDCPPTISLYTSASMHASDYYITPVKIDKYSILGIKLFSYAIMNEAESSDRDIKMKPLGIIYTMAEKTPSYRVSNLMNEFEGSDFIETMGLFETSMYANNDVRDGQQGNIMSKYVNSNANIKEIAAEFLRRVENNGSNKAE